MLGLPRIAWISFLPSVRWPRCAALAQPHLEGLGPGQPL